MALPETRYQFRTTLSDVERGVSAEQTLIILLHPSEAPERLFLRLIAWALFHVPGLTFGPGLCLPDEPSLFAEDLTGRKTVWIAVNPTSAERMNWAVRHNQGALVAAIFGGEGAWARYLDNSRTQKGTDSVAFALVEEALLAELTERIDERRYDVAITVLEDQLYLDFGKGGSFTGTVHRWTGPGRPLPA